MLIKRPAHERGQTLTDWLKSYHSFSFNEYFDRNWHHFYDLRVINEDFIAPKAGFDMHPHKNMEILTYLSTGGISHKDSLGNRFSLKPGDWQRMSAGTGIVHQEWNETEETTHLWQIWIRPNELNLSPSYEQKSFARILDRWQIIASNQSHDDALFIHQDMQLLRYFSSKPTQMELTLEQKPCYVQLIHGEALIEEIHLSDSDALICDNKESIKMTLPAETELLVFQFRPGVMK